MLCGKNLTNSDTRKKDLQKRSVSRSRSRSRSRTPPRRRDDERNSDKHNKLKVKSESLKDFDRLGSGRDQEKFVWGKKIEEMQKKGISQSELEEIEKERGERLAREIEKIRKKKLERENDQKGPNKEKMNRQDLMEEEAYKRWLEHEEKFHIAQAKLR